MKKMIKDDEIKKIKDERERLKEEKRLKKEEYKERLKEHKERLKEEKRLKRQEDKERLKREKQNKSLVDEIKNKKETSFTIDKNCDFWKSNQKIMEENLKMGLPF